MNPLARLTGSLLVLATATAASPVSTQWYVDASANCAAGTGSVASPFCTIGEAVAAASDGDTILIAAGIYTEGLVLRDDLTLIGSPGETVVDADGSNLDGVLIEDGANVSLVGLEIRDADFRRAGVRVASATPPAIVALTSSTISGHGFSGIFNTNGTVSVTDSTITENVGQYRGGGIYNQSGKVTLTGSSVSNNTAYSPTIAYGAGIFSGGELNVVDSAIDDNRTQTNFAGSFDSAYGGGLFNDTTGVATLINSSISRNDAYVTIAYFGEASGGGILSRGELTVDGCVLEGNTTFPAGSNGGRVIDSQAGTVQLRRSTIAGTYAGSATNLFAVRAGPGSRISDTIVWGNPTPFTPLSQIQPRGGNPFVHHSNVQGGWSGPGGFNLVENPQFVDPAGGNLRLRATSGMIDRGDPDSGIIGLDLFGGSRLNDGDLDRQMVVDIGAHEFSNVELVISGNAQPGGELTIDVSGLPGMSLDLAVGPPGAGARRDPFGLLFFDFGPSTRILGFGTSPRMSTVAIPGTVPTPMDFAVQVLALGNPLRTGRVPGNVSNPVFLTVE